MEKRNWGEYNEKLVRRGEMYISLDFLDNWDEELERMNYKRRWLAESFFSGVKRTFGENLRARSTEGMFREVGMKFFFYSMLINR